LSLLSVIAYYLNDNFEPRAILLAMLRMQGSHTAVNLKDQIVGLVKHFGLENTLGYPITDNASENQACLRLLAEDLAFDASKRHVLCIGHVINLEHAVTAEAVELAAWRRKGPIGKLHNIIRYILHSSERQDAFLALQITA
jgi:DNA-binding helix-hairpin-helix protein with protein kinase domain